MYRDQLLPRYAGFRTFRDFTNKALKERYLNRPALLITRVKDPYRRLNVTPFECLWCRYDLKVINPKSHVQPHQIDPRKQLTPKAPFPMVGIRLAGPCRLAVGAALPCHGSIGLAFLVSDHPRQQENRNPLPPRRHDSKRYRNVQTNRSNLAQDPSG